MRATRGSVSGGRWKRWEKVESPPADGGDRAMQAAERRVNHPTGELQYSELTFRSRKKND